MQSITKVVLISKPALRHDFIVFPANIWIFKFFFLMVFALKMILDNTYGLLNLLEVYWYHFNILVLAESEFKNSNVGGKHIEIMSQCWFWNKYDFSILEGGGFKNSIPLKFCVFDVKHPLWNSCLSIFL